MTDTEKILEEKGIKLQDLLEIAKEEIGPLYYQYPQIRAEHSIDDLVQDVVLYYLERRKDGHQRFEYYLGEYDTKHFINSFRQACRQEVIILPRYNYMKHKALSLNTTMKEDSETEYIDNIPAKESTETQLNESLEQIYLILEKVTKNNYYHKMKKLNPNLSLVEITVNVRTYLDISEKLKMEKNIIDLLNKGYTMRDVKKILNYPDFNEDVDNIKEAFTSYYNLES